MPSGGQHRRKGGCLDALPRVLLMMPVALVRLALDSRKARR